MDKDYIIGVADRCVKCDQAVMSVKRGKKLLKTILLGEKRQGGRCLTSYTAHECPKEETIEQI